MWPTALLRGAVSGVITAAVAVGAKFHTHVHVVAGTGHPLATTQITQTDTSNEWALAASGVTGLVLIIVALLNLLLPRYLDRRRDRDPKIRATKEEATDALVAELVRKEQTIQNQDAEIRSLKGHRECDDDTDKP